MTIGTIIILTIISILVAGAVCWFLYDDRCEIKTWVIRLSITTVCLVIMWGVGYWLCTHTEAGKRAYKTQQSNFGGGITREVKVYDVEGDMITRYKGKFDIEYDDDRILFDDENGNRHIIYYPTGTVIVDEVGE